MKILLITMTVLFALPCVGFLLQWLRWGVIPMLKDKIKEKRGKKNVIS